MIFDLTSRPKISQNLNKSRSKNRSVFGIDVGPLFLTFWPPKSSKSGPKCSQNEPRGGRRSDKIQSCNGPGPKMLPNGSEDSKSDHFGHRFYDLTCFTAFLSTNSPFVSYFTRVCECDHRWFLADSGQHTRVFRCWHSKVHAFMFQPIFTKIKQNPRVFWHLRFYGVHVW